MCLHTFIYVSSSTTVYVSPYFYVSSYYSYLADKRAPAAAAANGRGSASAGPYRGASASTTSVLSGVSICTVVLVKQVK